MWRTIYRLRKKSKAEKNKYAFFGAASLTTVVAMIWVVAVVIDLTSRDEEDGRSQVAAPIFSSFFSSAKKEFGGLKEELQELANRAENATTSTTTNATSTPPKSTSTPLPDASDLVVEGRQNGTTSTTTTSRVEESASPPPGRSTGREVRIGTSSGSSTNGS